MDKKAIKWELCEENEYFFFFMWSLLLQIAYVVESIQKMRDKSFGILVLESRISPFSDSSFRQGIWNIQFPFQKKSETTTSPSSSETHLSSVLCSGSPYINHINMTWSMHQLRLVVFFYRILQVWVHSPLF